MATSYTYKILNDEITSAKDYLKLCTRAFDIAADIIGEPLSVPTPTHFTPDLYYKKQYESAVEKYNEYKNMSIEEASEDMEKTSEREISYINNYNIQAKVDNKKLLNIKTEVEKWIPPTAKHKELKKFALDQINMSLKIILPITIKYDSDLSKDEIQDWLNSKINFCKKEVDRTYRIWQEEIKKAEEGTLWMKQFLNSLENI